MSHRGLIHITLLLISALPILFSCQKQGWDNSVLDNDYTITDISKTRTTGAEASKVEASRKQDINRTNKADTKPKAIGDTSKIIQFEDPEVKRICLLHYDLNHDGQISMYEAAQVKSLGLASLKRPNSDNTHIPYDNHNYKDWFAYNKKIKSFNELKYFVNIDSINAGCFNYCSNLHSITLPPNLKVIDEYAFTACPNLGQVDLPSKLKVIGSSAFERSQKKIHATFTFPATIKKIGFSAFWKNPRTSLKFLGDTPPEVWDMLGRDSDLHFSYTDTQKDSAVNSIYGVKIYVPSSAYTHYTAEFRDTLTNTYYDNFNKCCDKYNIPNSYQFSIFITGESTYIEKPIPNTDLVKFKDRKTNKVKWILDMNKHVGGQALIEVIDSVTKRMPAYTKSDCEILKINYNDTIQNPYVKYKVPVYASWYYFTKPNVVELMYSKVRFGGEYIYFIKKEQIIGY